MDIVNAGGVIAIPTDTVYGIGTCAFDQKAVSRLYLVKERSQNIPIPILIADMDQLRLVVSEVLPIALRLAVSFWPGPLTMVLPKEKGIAPSISATGTVGIRMPDHAFVRELIRRTGPMAVTSANISGSPSLTRARDVFEALDGKIDLVVDGGVAPGGIPSTVVDCSLTRPVILREGPLSQEDIAAVIEG